MEVEEEMSSESKSGFLQSIFDKVGIRGAGREKGQ